MRAVFAAWCDVRQEMQESESPIPRAEARFTFRGEPQNSVNFQVKFSSKPDIEIVSYFSILFLTLKLTNTMISLHLLFTILDLNILILLNQLAIENMFSTYILSALFTI